MNQSVDRTVANLNASFMRCTKCHAIPDARRWLLATGCNPDPRLRVPMREWFPPRGWAGSRGDAPRPLLVLSTNPGHPLPEEVARWVGFPQTVVGAEQLTAAQAEVQLSQVAAMYRGGRGRTSFHTRSVQVARSVLWLLGRKRVPLTAEWFDNVWFSDVVKCSTAKETGSPGLPVLAEQCRHLLEQELQVLGPTNVILALGASATKSVVTLNLKNTPIVSAPHPSGRGWRRIDASDNDAWLQRACSVLGLAWDAVGDGLRQVREALAEDPWCDIQ